MTDPKEVVLQNYRNMVKRKFLHWHNAARRVARRISQAYGAYRAADHAYRTYARPAMQYGKQVGAYMSYANARRRAYGLSKRPRAVRLNVRRPRSTAPKGYAYVTRGSLGKFRRAKRRARPDPFQKYGCVIKTETGGVQNDNNCVYVGHGVASGQIPKLLTRCIIKQLAQQMGQDFVSWEDQYLTAASKMQLSWTYYSDASSTTATQRNMAVTANITWKDLADALMNDMRTAWAGTNKHVLEEVWLNETPAGSSQQVVSMVRCKDLYVQLQVFSTMLVQNQTLAHTGVSEGESNLNDIANNPLTGKIYEGYSNSFEPKWRPPGDLSYTPFVANDSYGQMINDATDSIPTEIRKPPPASFWKRCTKSSNVVLNPGNIKKVSFSFARGFHCNQLISMFPNLFASVDADRVIDLGKFQMVGLEKVLDSRASEDVVSCAYEINQTLKMRGRYRPHQCAAPVLDIA